MSLRERRFSENQYRAIIGANKPTSVNRFATLADLVGSTPGVGELLYSEVTLTSLELGAPANHILIPAPGAGKYLDVISTEVVLEYGTVPFNFQYPAKHSDLLTIGMGSTQQAIEVTFTNSAWDNALVIPFDKGRIDSGVTLDVTAPVRWYGEDWRIDTPLTFNVSNFAKPTVGDSVMIFKMIYKIRNLGTEL